MRTKGLRVQSALVCIHHVHVLADGQVVLRSFHIPMPACAYVVIRNKGKECRVRLSASTMFLADGQAVLCSFHVSVPALHLVFFELSRLAESGNIAGKGRRLQPSQGVRASGETSGQTRVVDRDQLHDYLFRILGI